MLKTKTGKATQTAPPDFGMVRPVGPSDSSTQMHKAGFAPGVTRAARRRPAIAVPNAGASEQESAPLARTFIRAAVDSIPADRESDLLREIRIAADSGDPIRVREFLSKWLSIGAFYADPDREANHPLGPVLGMFKDEPLLDFLSEAIARQRADESASSRRE